MEQIGHLEREQPKDTPSLVKIDLVKKRRRRLPSEERMRHELIYQLRESLRSSQEKMNSLDLTVAEGQRWTQVHTYTAQVLNTILKDLQLHDWEIRLQEIESASHNRHIILMTPERSHRKCQAPDRIRDLS